MKFMSRYRDTAQNRNARMDNKLKLFDAVGNIKGFGTTIQEQNYTHDKTGAN
jgi:hypothetical protein